MKTRTVRVSKSRLARIGGTKYLAQFIGRKVVYKTCDGDELVGHITEPTSHVHPAPIAGLMATFPDGKWANIGHTLTLVEED